MSNCVSPHGQDIALLDGDDRRRTVGRSGRLTKTLKEWLGSLLDIPLRPSSPNPQLSVPQHSAEAKAVHRWSKEKSGA